jgi:hypothetical protein
MKFISDTKWLSLITETYFEGLDAHTDDDKQMGEIGVIFRGSMSIILKTQGKKLE